MTPEIQALVTKLQQATKCCGYMNTFESSLAALIEEAAAALVQQAQLLEEKKNEDLTRVDGHTVMPPERATAAENEAIRAPFCSVNPPSLFRAAQEALAFLDSVEWNDGTSETDAANVIAVLQEALESAEAPDAVARAEGISTSGPRALDSDLHAVCNQTIENYERNIAELVEKLARVTAEREELQAIARKEMASAETYRDHYLATKARAEAAEAALSAHRELLRRYLDNHCQASDREGVSALCECRLCNDTRDRLAALASPRQAEHEQDKDEDLTRVAESSQPDRAALPQRPTS